MLIAEFMTEDGPIYINADHVIYVTPDRQDKREAHIHLTHPRHTDGHVVVVRHTAIDVVLRLYKGME